MKQSTVKETYINIQTRLISVAFLFLYLMSASVMALESFNMMRADPQIDQIIIIMSIFLGIMCNMVAMLIVEVVYQDEIHEFPFIRYLGRLTPELNSIQRESFLIIALRRQLVSTALLAAFWVMVGNTHRSTPIMLTMMAMTAFTIFGIYHVRSIFSSSESEIEVGHSLQ